MNVFIIFFLDILLNIKRVTREKENDRKSDVFFLQKVWKNHDLSDTN